MCCGSCWGVRLHSRAWASRSASLALLRSLACSRDSCSACLPVILQRSLVQRCYSLVLRCSRPTCPHAVRSSRISSGFILYWLLDRGSPPSLRCTWMSVLEKLRQRKLAQWGLAYLAGAWVLL